MKKYIRSDKIISDKHSKLNLIDDVNWFFLNSKFNTPDYIEYQDEDSILYIQYDYLYNEIYRMTDDLIEWLEYNRYIVDESSDDTVYTENIITLKVYDREE